MRNASTIILALVAACLLIGMLGCTSLALSGGKKYKVDVTNVLLRMKAQIEQDGEIADGTVSKLKSVMSKYEAEFSQNGSYVTCKRIVETLEGAKDSSLTTFQMNQNVMQMIVDVLETLKTEIKD